MEAEQKELQKRKEAADASSAWRAALPSFTATWSVTRGNDGDRTPRHRSAPKVADPDFTENTHGDLVAKTPRGGLLTVTAYLTAHAPPENDPGTAAYRQALRGLTMADEALSLDGTDPAEKAMNTLPTPAKNRQNSGKGSPDRRKKGYDARNEIT